jgi:hypothetical protein
MAPTERGAGSVPRAHELVPLRRRARCVPRELLALDAVLWRDDRLCAAAAGVTPAPPCQLDLCGESTR